MSRPSTQEPEVQQELEIHQTLLIKFDEYLNYLKFNSRLHGTKFEVQGNIALLMRDFRSGIISSHKLHSSIKFETTLEIERGGDLEELKKEDSLEENLPKKKFLEAFKLANEIDTDVRPLIEDAVASTAIYLINLAKNLEKYQVDDQILVLAVLQKLFQLNPTFESRHEDSPSFTLNDYLKNIAGNGAVFPLATLENLPAISRVLYANPSLAGEPFQVCNRSYVTNLGSVIVGQGETLFQKYLDIDGAEDILKYILSHLKESEMLRQEALVLYDDGEKMETIIDSIFGMEKYDANLCSDLIEVLARDHHQFLTQCKPQIKDDAVASKVEKALARPATEVAAQSSKQLKAAQIAKAL